MGKGRYWGHLFLGFETRTIEEDDDESKEKKTRE